MRDVRNNLPGFHTSAFRVSKQRHLKRRPVLPLIFPVLTRIYLPVSAIPYIGLPLLTCDYLCSGVSTYYLVAVETRTTGSRLSVTKLHACSNVANFAHMTPKIF
jgi:hypothetical protein